MKFTYKIKDNVKLIHDDSIFGQSNNSEGVVVKCLIHPTLLTFNKRVPNLRSSCSAFITVTTKKDSGERIEHLPMEKRHRNVPERRHVPVGTQRKTQV